MEKKNYNLEIYFESLKKSFVILSKNKISFEEIKQKTMKEFGISKEFEKDMKFTTIVDNKQIIILNDIQILKHLEEMSKNNYYLKLHFNIYNKNYKYYPSKSITTKINYKIKPNNTSSFYIISKNNNNNNNIKDDENKYKEEIKKLKEELEKLKSEKTTKGEFDIRKFDEKYRDLNNKNNTLEQKIIELENENKTLKVEKSKRINNMDNFSLENITFENEYLFKEIEKCIGKVVGEQYNNIIEEITNLKSNVNNILKEQKTLNDKINNIDLTNNKIKIIEKDTKLENIKGINKKENYIENNDENGNKNISKDNDDENNQNIEENNIIIEDNDNNEYKKNINNEIHYNNNVNDNNSNNMIHIDDNNFDILDNLDEIFIGDNDNENNNKNIINSNIEHKEEDEKEEIIINTDKDVKRKINYYEEEDEKNSKSFKPPKNNIKPKNIIKELKNNFLNDNNNLENNILSKNLNNKKNKKYYTKYTNPQKNKVTNIKNQKHIFNYTNVQKDLFEDDLLNNESSSDIYSEIKKAKNSKVNSSYSQKQILKKISKKNIKLNITDKITPNDNNITPKYIFKLEKKEKKNSFIIKKEDKVTPSHKVTTIKENIENYFIAVFQNIFFYGNNGYVNMLNISDKLINKLKEGIRQFRLNLNDIKDVCIKYISFSILPIVNDSNTKEYQRKIIKSKISTVLEILKIEKNYFDKEYKDINKDKKDKYEEKNINFDINVTHAKINEFRKIYDLKEKDYPDELIVKALIRYRGNREMAFQYLFY